jgi:hypothetical protein
MLQDTSTLTKKEKLRLLVDSESLDELLVAGNQRAQKLLKYSDTDLFDFIRSCISSGNPLLQKTTELKQIYDATGRLVGFRIATESGETSVAFPYKMDDVRDVAARVYGRRAVTQSELESTVLVFAQAMLLRFGYSYLLLTYNYTFLNNRLWFESHFPGQPVNIVSVDEAISFMDLFAKFRNVYYVSSRFHCNRGLWYWYGLRTLVPSYQLPWNCVVFGLPIRGGKDVLQGFSGRFQHLLRAIDEIGFEFYKGVSGDTMDGMMYHLNYFVTLVTGLFDNLAMLATLRHDMCVRGVDILKFKNMSRISLTRRAGKDFLKSLKEHNVKLHEFIDDNEEFIEMFYPLREEIIHRSRLKASRLIYVGQDVRWRINAIQLRADIAKTIEKFNEKSPRELATRWGIYRSGRVCLVEPYRFVRAASWKLFEFCNKYLELLDFGSCLEKRREVKERIDDHSKSKTAQSFDKDMEVFKKDHLGWFQQEPAIL